MARAITQTQNTNAMRTTTKQQRGERACVFAFSMVYRAKHSLRKSNPDLPPGMSSSNWPEEEKERFDVIVVDESSPCGSTSGRASVNFFSASLVFALSRCEETQFPSKSSCVDLVFSARWFRRFFSIGLDGRSNGKRMSVEATFFVFLLLLRLSAGCLGIQCPFR